MANTSTASYEQALALYQSGDFEASHEAVLELLQASPQDPSLLRLAGKAGVELGRDDAVGQLEQAAAADPDNPDAWRDLADALLAEGRSEDATNAIKQGIERRPEDVALLVDLAHVIARRGNTDAAIATLEQVLELDFGTSPPCAGSSTCTARRTASRTRWTPAARSSPTGRDSRPPSTSPSSISPSIGWRKRWSVRRLRDIDDEPDHEVYAMHGMIEAELRRERVAHRPRPRRRRDARRPLRPHDRHPRLRRHAGLRRGRLALRRRAATSMTPSPPLATSTADSMPPLASRAATAPKAKADEVQWTRCPSCEAFVYHKRLKRNLGVCPECNYHFRLPVRERLAQLLDEGSFEDLSQDIVPVDALGFADSKPYTARLEEAQRKTGLEGALYGRATIGGNPIVVAAMDFAFIGGSMGWERRTTSVPSWTASSSSSRNRSAEGPRSGPELRELVDAPKPAVERLLARRSGGPRRRAPGSSSAIRAGRRWRSTSSRAPGRAAAAAVGGRGTASARATVLDAAGELTAADLAGPSAGTASARRSVLDEAREPGGPGFRIWTRH